MANTYTWVVNSLKILATVEDQTNVVVNVNWTATATDNASHTASMTQNTRLEYQKDSPFISLANLTETQVIEWVKAELGDNRVTGFESYLDGQINSLITPPVLPSETPLPWATK